MTTAIVGIIFTALSIEADKLTQYKHHVLPMIAIAGMLTAVVSLTL